MKNISIYISEKLKISSSVSSDPVTYSKEEDIARSNKFSDIEKAIIRDSVDRVFQGKLIRNNDRECFIQYVWFRLDRAMELLKENPKRYYVKGFGNFDNVAEYLLDDMDEEIDTSSKSNEHTLLYQALSYMCADMYDRLK